MLFARCSHGCCSTPSPLFRGTEESFSGSQLQPRLRGLCFSWEVQSPAVVFIGRKKGRPVQWDKAGIVLCAQTEACQRLRALNIPRAALARKPQSECHLREDALSAGEGEGSPKSELSATCNLSELASKVPKECLKCTKEGVIAREPNKSSTGKGVLLCSHPQRLWARIGRGSRGPFVHRAERDFFLFPVFCLGDRPTYLT